MRYVRKEKWECHSDELKIKQQRKGTLAINVINDPKTCRFKQEKCHSCGKIGHIGRACRNRNKQSESTQGKKGRNWTQGRAPSHKSRSHHVTAEEESDEMENVEQALSMYNMQDAYAKVKPFTAELQVNGEIVKFELDAGCNITLMNEPKFNAHGGNAKKPLVRPTSLKLKTYTGESIKVLGVAEVKVNCQNQQKTLPYYVVSGTGPSLLGRSWLEKLKLNMAEIHKVNALGGGKLILEQVLVQHEEVFKDELGTLKGVKATIHVTPDATPRYFSPR